MDVHGCGNKCNLTNALSPETAANRADLSSFELGNIKKCIWGNVLFRYFNHPGGIIQLGR